MVRPLKRTRTRKTEKEPREPEPEPRFDDNEPIGEIESETDDSQAPIPSFDMGTDSTKPTAFDKLPWKKVRLPDFLGDGLSFDPDGGGLLGLEELDGSVWEDIKQSSRKRNLDQLEETDTQLKIEGQEISQQPASEVTPSQATIDKELRKKAKKERLAKLRQLKKDAQANKPDIPNTDSVNDSKNGPKRRESNQVEDELDDIDWAATADLDGMSDMERDVDNQLIMLPFDDSLLPAWLDLKLASPIKRALYNLSFTKPTAVQEASLPISLSSSDSPRDLVVIAETGSGKTLAYALPILNALILSPPSPMLKSSPQILPIVTLVLTPTRELCLQVKAHIDTFLKAMCSETQSSQEEGATNEPSSSKNRTGITTVSICGGIAIAKQRKQLERSKKLMEPGKGGLGCIVIATPGRLWDMIQSWDEFAEGIKRKLDWLIIDEADKMIEKGHFEELEKILKLTKRPKDRRPRHTTDNNNADEDDGEEEEWEDEWTSQANDADNYIKEKIRTMVFSATMDKNLQINLKKRSFKGKPPAVGGSIPPADPMHDLLEQIDFRDPHPELIDLTPQGRMVGGLKECKIECVLKDKDLYLLHFMLRYTGRTIVFLSSISALRRLSPMLNLLLPDSTVLTLHSEMQQRSRLKSLDRFRSSSNSILLSTDVAARGLDIPQVDHVIHYQVPRSSDCYVHRSGRTARAGKGGVALALIAPDELKTWRSLMKNLGRADDLPSPPIEHSISNKLKELLELAKKIDTLEHKSTKQSHDENWMKKTAEMLEIDLDHSNDESDGDDQDKQPKKGDNKAMTQAKILRARLKEKLADPLIIKNNSLIIRSKANHQHRPRKINNCFIKDPQVIKNFLSNQNHSHLVGLDRSVNALNELS
ncbi:ATP-dependent RNA helicase [Puccinia graminis f. sp. tritici]|uniref:ATP-dependent RNA helicase n=2 Tax=Puccinia graminis f. sp. tritici TaxID=56615 RepID=E3JUY2_PUCGT|nr:uncharacterized protein PGTG_01188 [Puccinia graminis f. sp. tritici CRL 75-36-700-3]EFP75857.1 hypothetical protein PGTG_01188 [Puccinia graminis f. sp. tritici CRL 75-36-700-3]KAA1077448.1 ATP-dependent RNA helicase [Puccinia graminis f. sp. tritici]